nr:MAG: hypothetical protein DIU55_10870 [Bacillota bacterium]
MRRLLYAIAALLLAAGSVGLALLPRIASGWLWFGVLGACFSGIGAAGWVLGGVAAGEWPRLRAGWFLLPAGVLGVVLATLDSANFSLFWAAGEALTGLLLLVPLFPRSPGGASSGRPPGPVQAPPVAGRHEGR